uniref:ABC transporter domain-containing protein n=1 Tax=Fagus sylvatica TaxID=28930 RepID=A0A2N9IG69_FAGSY
MGTERRQLKAMLRKNWLLKIRHPFITAAEILLPTVVMLLLIAVRTQVDTQIHPTQPYIRKDMFVEVGKGISPNFQQILELLLAKGEYLAFAPATEETRTMINLMSMKFPLLKISIKTAVVMYGPLTDGFSELRFDGFFKGILGSMGLGEYVNLMKIYMFPLSVNLQLVTRVYKDELDLETYIRSDVYGTCNQVKNCSNPKIKAAVVFHEQGPLLFDYSIRLNHTWAFSGFPDVKSIMDVNGPYLNDLELGVNIVPTMQYSVSGFLTLQQVLDAFIIFTAQQAETYSTSQNIELPSVQSSGNASSLKLPLMQFSPSNIRIAPFPTREYTDDEFQSIIKKVMGVLYLLGFLYPISRLISFSVFEKFAISSGIITACTMDSLFKYSDKSVVFMYFFLFGLSAIMLSFLISTFFTRAKTAVAVGTLSFLGAYFPYYTVNDEAVPMILKVLASLLSPTAFALGSINFADYERAHVGLRWSNIWRASSGVNFLVCLLMMLVDALLYCVIGLYLDKVLPRENGVRYPWNFIFRSCFWKNKSIDGHHTSNLKVASTDKKTSFSRKDIFEPAVEVISLDMKQQELDGRCIQIRNLHKVYATKKGKCCAVNSLQLTLYENQILALLGHNGAGKSTTISMLVGLLTPTSGDATVFGKNIITDMDEIRKTLGVCPQNDILFAELTVKEHSSREIFAILKGCHIEGVKEEFLERVVMDMIDEVSSTLLQ